MTAVGCHGIIKLYKSNHAESNHETQNLQQDDAQNTDMTYSWLQKNRELSE
jgi:hypothetical protein